MGTAAKSRIPTAPRDLKHAGKAYWKAVTREFQLDDAQLITLSEACRCLDLAWDADAVVRRDGLTVEAKGGRLHPHPCIGTARDCRSVFIRLVKSLNLDLEPLHDGVGRPPGK